MSISDTALSMAATWKPHTHLQGADGVTIGNENTSTTITESESATLTHIAVSAHQRALPASHHINCTHDTVGDRVTATVHVVELGLRHAIIHVDGGEEQPTFGDHLLQLEDTCGQRRRRSSPELLTTKWCLSAANPAPDGSLRSCTGTDILVGIDRPLSIPEFSERLMHDGNSRSIDKNNIKDTVLVDSVVTKALHWRVRVAAAAAAVVAAVGTCSTMCRMFLLRCLVCLSPFLLSNFSSLCLFGLALSLSDTFSIAGFVSHPSGCSPDPAPSSGAAHAGSNIDPDP